MAGSRMLDLGEGARNDRGDWLLPARLSETGSLQLITCSSRMHSGS